MRTKTSSTGRTARLGDDVKLAPRGTLLHKTRGLRESKRTEVK